MQYANGSSISTCGSWAEPQEDSTAKEVNLKTIVKAVYSAPTQRAFLDRYRNECETRPDYQAVSPPTLSKILNHGRQPPRSFYEHCEEEAFRLTPFGSEYYDLREWPPELQPVFDSLRAEKIDAAHANLKLLLLVLPQVSDELKPAKYVLPRAYALAGVTARYLEDFIGCEKYYGLALKHAEGTELEQRYAGYHKNARRELAKERCPQPEYHNTLRAIAKEEQ